MRCDLSHYEGKRVANIDFTTYTVDLINCVPAIVNSGPIQKGPKIKTRHAPYVSKNLRW